MRYQWLVTAALATGFAPAAQLAYAAEYLSTESAQRAAFPDASAFEPVLITANVKAAIAREAGRFAVEPRVFRVRTGDHGIGWFIVDEVIGKVELITYALALDATGAVKSLDVLAYRESHGDAIRLAAWRAQFTGKRASDPVKLDADIRNISGATLSSRHVTEGVHRLLLIYEKALARG
ncbi:MAG: FMN-binding protein [Aromatoleum sp.]|nr:FMN-binding protein [Aromatoleum sp.]